MYHLELGGSPAEEYLGGRGLLDAAPQFLLGYVAEPEPGHDHRFSGMLSIPYITPAGVVGFKFRRLTEGSPATSHPLDRGITYSTLRRSLKPSITSS